MFFKLLAVFVGVPLIELALLIKVEGFVGLWATLLLVIVTGILGAALARHEGLKTWRRIQECLQTGQSPADDLIEGLMILIAGAVLLTPGLLTDMLGFALLIGPMRRRFRKAASSYFQKRVTIARYGPISDQQEHEIIDPPNDPPQRPPGDFR